MSLEELQTLEEKCTALINDLARYGKRGDTKVIERFPKAKRAMDDENAPPAARNPIAIVQSMAGDIYKWANALEKTNPTLSTNLNFFEEWNTVKNAAAVLELLYRDKSAKRPRMFSDFQKRITIQQAAQDKKDERYRESFASVGGYGD